MNPVRVALSKILKEDGALKAVAPNGVFHRIADQGTPTPYVIFHKASGVPRYAFDGPSMDRDVWLVKGVGSRADAEAIDQRCQELLADASLDIEGKAHQDIRKMSDVDYDEMVDGERVNHVGAEYKLDSENE